MLSQTREISLTAAEAIAILTSLGHYLELTEPERQVVEKLIALFPETLVVRETGRALLERTEAEAVQVDARPRSGRRG
jgi:hypothetical protein